MTDDRQMPHNQCHFKVALVITQIIESVSHYIQELNAVCTRTLCFFRATFNESRMYEVAYLDARVSDRPKKACDSSLTKLNSGTEHHKISNHDCIIRDLNLIVKCCWYRLKSYVYTINSMSSERSERCFL